VTTLAQADESLHGLVGELRYGETIARSVYHANG
jgi:hypothetical protein